VVAIFFYVDDVILFSNHGKPYKDLMNKLYKFFTSCSLDVDLTYTKSWSLATIKRN
jgi:hypothetical protein